MPVYPTLVPDRISYDLGRQNVSEQQTLAGPVRFRHTMQTSGYDLELAYENLTQSEVNIIRQHYFESDGAHRLFTVPNAIWGDASIVSVDSLYRYNEAPTEEHRGVYFTVRVNLRIIAGVNLLYILNSGGASQPPVEPFFSFAFDGNAPFILDGSSVAPTLLLDGRGASQ